MGAKECACATSSIFLLEKIDLLKSLMAERVGETPASKRAVLKDFSSARDKIDEVERYCDIDLMEARERVDSAEDFFEHKRWQNALGEVFHSGAIVRTEILRGRGGEF